MIAAGAAVLLALALGAGPASGRPRQEPDDGPPVELRSDLVLVPVAARRVSGGAVTDLGAPDFVLTEDGVGQEIAVFRHDAASADVVLLVDGSASVEGSLEVIRKAARAFLSALRPEDRVSVVAFADRPMIVSEWTADRELVDEAIGAIRPHGSTVLYGSVVAALAERFQASGAGRRRAMVVLTDGLDTLSTVTSRTAAQTALRYEVSVYVVSTSRIEAEATRAAIVAARLSPRERARHQARLGQLARAEEALEHLADQTGGRVLYPKGPGDLRKAYAEVAGEIRSRYLLGYYPSSPAPGRHVIGVTVRRKDVTVHARRGYFRE